MLGFVKFLFAAAALACAFPAAAQTFPDQPVRMIAPFPPGGSVDIVARLVSGPMAEQLGAKIIIDNRSGASGNIGMEAAARARPDGYSIVLNTLPLITNQYLFPSLTYDAVKDFTPIGMVASSQHVLVVHNKFPAARVDELVRLARAKPGKLSYASAGAGSTFHFCAEMFKDATQTFILHVPYRGGGPALLDTLSGQVDMSFPVLSAALPHIKAGTLRALAVTDTVRSPLLPEVPTLKEAGVKDFQFTQWMALLAPAGTPPGVVNRLNAALGNALKSPDVRDKFKAGAFDAFITTPDEAGKFLASESRRLAQLIKSRGIKAE